MEPWSLPKRRSTLKEVQAEPSEGSHPLNFRRSYDYYPVHKVPIGLPVYRLRNGRTLANQKEHIARNSLPNDFFMRDPESIEALAAQDIILRGMVKEEGMFDLFKNPQTIQDEPIILDEHGYIINGNRRVCAFRMLLDTPNYTHYTNYEYIRVIILPKCTEEEILQLEAQLQTQPDVKADYSWITQALLFKQQMLEYGYDYKRLGQIHGKKPSEIRNLIDMVEYADDYLSSRNTSDRYSDVENHQFVFTQIIKYRKKQDDPYDQELLKELSFKLMDSEEITGRRYSTVKQISDNLDFIKKELVDAFKIENNPNEDAPSSQELDLLTPVVEEDETDEPQNDELNEEIVEFVKTTEDPEEILEVTTEAIESSERVTKINKNKESFRDYIQQAQTNLENAKSCYQTDSVTVGVIKHITNIEGAIKDIRNLIK